MSLKQEERDIMVALEMEKADWGAEVPDPVAPDYIK
jgi:hypothetical protein